MFRASNEQEPSHSLQRLKSPLLTSSAWYRMAARSQIAVKTNNLLQEKFFSKKPYYFQLLYAVLLDLGRHSSSVENVLNCTLTRNNSFHFAYLWFWMGSSLAHGGVTSAAKPTSSCELEDDWSERWGGRSGGRSSSMITVSSCGMLTVGESW